MAEYQKQCVECEHKQVVGRQDAVVCRNCGQHGLVFEYHWPRRRRARLEEDTVRASTLFLDTFCTDETLAAVRCDCGRWYFTADSRDCGVHRQRQATDPENNFERPGIRFGRIEGLDFVYDCPCNRMTGYEVLFRENQKKILQFFRARAAKAKDSADRDLDVIDGFIFLLGGDDTKRIAREAEGS